MARNYQITYFFADPNNELEYCSPKEVSNLMERYIEDNEYGFIPRHTKALRTRYYQWNDNVPENNPDLPMEVWEERFLE